jgi:hypothetical protein
MTYPWQITVPGASPADLARAGAALSALFEASGITPVESAQAVWRSEGQEMPGAEPIEWTERDTEAADLWDRRERVALAAACSGWAQVPELSECDVSLDPEHVRSMLNPSRAQWIDRCVQRLALRDKEIPAEVANEDAAEMSSAFGRLSPEYVADMASGFATTTDEFEQWVDGAR